MSVVKEVICNGSDRNLKWNGWGYEDSYFFVNEDGVMEFHGKRYEIGGRKFPKLVEWMRNTLNLDIKYKDFGREALNTNELPVSSLNNEFVDWLRQQQFSFSTDGITRARRSHGHSLEEMVRLRTGRWNVRIPDLVVWPKNHSQVSKIVDAAKEMNVVIIPIGGGTSVSAALKCPRNETRCIVSLDTTQMNKILWIDEKNLLAKAESGIIGIDLEKQLNQKGFTIGHEPDSVEFSSLGGWVATRASGIKKNRYGNIEDIIVHVILVTPSGTIEKSCIAPRISSGPDLHHLIMGSEGTLGVVTQVAFKICPLPECKKYGSILFPTFENGISALREIARQKIAPASIRLIDNEQFKFGQALKPESTYQAAVLDFLKRLYVTKWKGFDPNQMSPATVVFEGTRDEVQSQEKRIYAIAAKYGGLPAGEENGKNGYTLTFSIAYIRDVGLDYLAVAESFETSVPWDCVAKLCRNVKELCTRECKRLGVVHPSLISSRVTQLYDAGACVYFYFGFNYRDMNFKEEDISLGDESLKLTALEKALHVYEKIEAAARDEILKCGGSISHHHGVGKIRQQWLPETIGQVGLSTLKAIKNHLDPNNIFASGNLFSVSKL